MAAYVRRVGRIATGSAYFVIPATVRSRLDARCLRRLVDLGARRDPAPARAAAAAHAVRLPDELRQRRRQLRRARRRRAGRAARSPPRTDRRATNPLRVAALRRRARRPTRPATVEARYPGVATDHGAGARQLRDVRAHARARARRAPAFPTSIPRRRSSSGSDGGAHRCSRDRPPTRPELRGVSAGSAGAAAALAHDERRASPAASAARATSSSAQRLGLRASVASRTSARIAAAGQHRALPLARQLLAHAGDRLVELGRVLAALAAVPDVARRARRSR